MEYIEITAFSEDFESEDVDEDAVRFEERIVSIPNAEWPMRLTYVKGIGEQEGYRLARKLIERGKLNIDLEGVSR